MYDSATAVGQWKYSIMSILSTEGMVNAMHTIIYTLHLMYIEDTLKIHNPLFDYYSNQII